MGALPKQLIDRASVLANRRPDLFFVEGQEMTEHTSTQHAPIQILSGESESKLTGAKPVDPEITGMETAVPAQAPNVPPPITRQHATKVIVSLEVREVTKRLADGEIIHQLTGLNQDIGETVRILRQLAAK